MEETMELLKKQIDEMIEGLKYTTDGSEEERATVADIQRLVDAYADLKKLQMEEYDSERKFKEDIRQKDQDRYYRDTLERDRMALEKEKFEMELNLKKEVEDRKLQEEKKSGIRDVAVKVAGIAIPTLIYGGALMLGLKLEFIDHGSICSFGVKELMKAASKPMKV